ncbi:MAG: glutamyl-tRNA reductase [Elusimicrobia bacterium]|nr:glutamyl-tRNA reductase [Elusimicrobiota bacterium]
MAPIASRERVAVAAQDVEGVLRGLKSALGLGEAVLLSTCSRLELYGTASDPERVRAPARAWFIGRAGVEIETALVARGGGAVLTHLFRVAAGLDSWIVGESEILGQVKRAYETARGACATGPVLNRAFQSALAAGKAARTQTGIQNGVHSIGGAAAMLARGIFGLRDGGGIVVFGAGDAAEAAVRHLAAKNFRRICVANRTAGKAEALAARVGGRGVSVELGLALLTEVEVAIFSTASPAALLEPAALADVMRRRRGRPLFIVDLGLPRNVDPACAAIGGVFLYDLESLRGVVARSVAGKAGETEKAEALVARAASACAAEIDKAAALRVPREAAACAAS